MLINRKNQIVRIYFHCANTRWGEQEINLRRRTMYETCPINPK